MQIGERIKKIREFRDITQKDLGVDLGFPANSAAVRIAQYENGSRIPKKETAIAISQKLRCNYINFYDEGLRNSCKSLCSTESLLFPLSIPADRKSVV